jgi:hypothetical protein
MIGIDVSKVGRTAQSLSEKLNDRKVGVDSWTMTMGERSELYFSSINGSTPSRSVIRSAEFSVSFRFPHSTPPMQSGPMCRYSALG